MEDIAECFEKGPFTVNRNYIEEILVGSKEKHKANQKTKKSLRHHITRHSQIKFQLSVLFKEIHIMFFFFFLRSRGCTKIKQLSALWVNQKTTPWGFMSSAKWEAQKDTVAYTPKDRLDS